MTTPSAPSPNTTCQHCGTAFIAKRAAARFCGDTCRKRAQRGIPPHQRIGLPRGDAKRWRG